MFLGQWSPVHKKKNPAFWDSLVEGTGRLVTDPWDYEPFLRTAIITMQNIRVSLCTLLYGKSWRVGKKRDQWDTNCIFAESVGFYTLETDQDNVTFGSALFGGWTRSRTLIGVIWREMLKQTIFDISQSKRQPVCRCHNIPDRKGKNQRGAYVFETRLLSIKGWPLRKWQMRD